MKYSSNKLVAIEGWISVIINTILFAVKYWAGVVTGSVALIADAWHSLTDSFSSAIVIFSARLSRRPADEEHPFGHGRTDLVSSVIIGVLLFVVGLEFVGKGIHQLKVGEEVIFGRLALIVTLFSIGVKELLAQFSFWGARETESIILKADGWHHRTDSLSSVLVLAGIFLGKYFWWIDGVLGVLIGFMIFYAAYEILRDATHRLMGEIPEPELIQKIQQIIFDLDLEVCPHHFHMHKYGDHVEMTFHILLEPQLTLENAHEKANKIEQAIRIQLDIEATIHMEPVDKVMNQK